MSNAFKPLKCGELVRPYPYNVHKNWVVTDSNYRDDYYLISIVKGITPLLNQKINVSESVDNIIVRESDEIDNSSSNNESLLSNKHQKVIWSGLNQMFYKYRADNERILYTSASIFSVPVKRMGDGIKTNSITITDNSVTSSAVSSLTLTDIKVNEYRGNIVDSNIDTSSYVSSEKLLGYWGFNDEFLNRTMYGGTIKDNSVYNHNAYGRHIIFTDGINTSGHTQLPSGTQIKLNGSSSYMRVDHTKNLGFNKDDSYSISLWATLPTLQPDLSDNYNWIVSKNGTYRDYGYDGLLNATFNRRNIATSIYPFDLKVYNQNDTTNFGKLVASISDGLNTTSITSSIKINDSTQHHIVFNKTSTNLELWIDGTLDVSASLSLNDNVNNEYDIVFGSKFLSDSGTDVVSSGFKSLSGYLDEIRIYNTNLSQQQIELLSNNDYVTGSAYQSSVVGEVFYKHGMVVISDPRPLYKNVLVGASGDWDYGSDRGFNVKYKSTKKLYEVSLICDIGANEFNVSQNPSLRLNNDINSELLKGFVTGSDFRPYITTIGLYNSLGELLAVAKLGSALKKRYDVDLNINVRFDLNGHWGTPVIDNLPQNIEPTLYQNPSGGFTWNAPSEIVDWVSTTDNTIIKPKPITNVVNQLPNVPVVLDSDAELFINAASITDLTQINAIDTLVTDMKSANIWDKMIAIYPFVGGTATTHKFNLKDPQDLDSSYRLSFVGGWTHSSTGAKPNGTNAYANTFLGTDTIGLNSGHLSFYSRTDIVPTLDFANDMGVLQDFPGVDSYSDISAGKKDTFPFAGTRFNESGGGPTVAVPTDTLGFYCNTRTASNVIKLFKNGSAIISASTVTGRTTTFPIFIGAINIVAFGSVNNPGGYSPREQAFASIGTGLTDSEVTSLTTIVQNYNTSLSRNV
jgi:hypothetical protein